MASDDASAVFLAWLIQLPLASCLFRRLLHSPLCKLLSPLFCHLLCQLLHLLCVCLGLFNCLSFFFHFKFSLPLFSLTCKKLNSAYLWQKALPIHSSMSLVFNWNTWFKSNTWSLNLRPCKPGQVSSSFLPWCLIHLASPAWPPHSLPSLLQALFTDDSSGWSGQFSLSLIPSSLN